jgi:hypothetical protein
LSRFLLHTDLLLFHINDYGSAFLGSGLGSFFILNLFYQKNVHRGGRVFMSYRLFIPILSFSILSLLMTPFTMAASQSTVNHDGVTLPQQMKIGAHTLVLNGMGTRKATFLKVKVYVAGLYLKQQSQKPEEILTSPQVKHLEIVFTHDVSSKKLATAWAEGFEKNCQIDCASMQSALSTLQAMMKDVQSGDHLALTFYTDHLDVSLKGHNQGSIRHPLYSKTLLLTWLGSDPPNAELKAGLLDSKRIL